MNGYQKSAEPYSSDNASTVCEYPTCRGLKLIWRYLRNRLAPRQISHQLNGPLRSGDVRLLSGLIGAYTEQVEENDYLKYIREEVENAEIIVFLGFGFYAPNFRLISSGRKSNVRRIYGTALNLSKSDIDETISQISQTIFVSSRDSGARSRALAAERTELRKDLKCFELFDQYRRSLSASL